MTASAVHPLSSTDTRIVSRAIDAVDRAHARAAMWLHERRNKLRARLERGIARAEDVTSTALQRAHRGVERFDVASADAVNRAQGVVGQTIEKARHRRSKVAPAATR
jgi:hypothetical protein